MEKEIRAIFTHNSNQGKTQNFLQIPDDIQISGFEIKGHDSSGFERMSFNGLKFKKGMNPGSVFKFLETEKGTYKFSSNQLPMAKWSNTVELAKWQALNDSDKRLISDLKKISKNEISFLLEPIKKAYKESDYRQRELILAQLIRAITS